MLAAIINALAIVLGSTVGLLLKKRLTKSFGDVIFVAAGMLSLVIGIIMALQTRHMLYLALSLVGGGILGAAIHLEDGILAVGERLRIFGERFQRDKAARLPDGEHVPAFAKGFLEASVLFCAGSMAILGSIQAGTSGNYQLILTKSVMDGFIAILLSAGLGAGVMASAVSVLVYQGTLTVLAAFLAPYISDTIRAMISSVGGPLVMMIGINLLGLRKIPTGNFLPSLALGIAFALVDPWIPELLRG
jgi:hypothetical protein